MVISWNTISAGRAFAKKLSCNFNIFQPVDVLVRDPYGHPLFLLAPDHRWCSIYSCKINQTAMSVPIFASQHQNNITELKQSLCRMLRCVGKCELVSLSQERMAEPKHPEEVFSSLWSSVNRCCILQVDHFTLVTFTYFYFFFSKYRNRHLKMISCEGKKKCFPVSWKMARFPQGKELWMGNHRCPRSAIWCDEAMENDRLNLPHLCRGPPTLHLHSLL